MCVTCREVCGLIDALQLLLCELDYELMRPGLFVPFGDYRLEGLDDWESGRMSDQVMKVVSVLGDPDNAGHHNDARFVFALMCERYGITVNLEDEDRPVRIGFFDKLRACVPLEW